MRSILATTTLVLFALCGGCAGHSTGAAQQSKTVPDGWRSLPLVTGGKVDPAWLQTGYGGFVVDDGVLRTNPDARGLGLLVYSKEKLGDCQVRVVYRPKEQRSNSGVYIRVDDGILPAAHDKIPAATRSESGALTPEGSKAMEEASEKELGAWYAVHHGYEVQIADGGDDYHRTGALYSYSKAAPLPERAADGWRTMVITLKGTHVSVDVDGKHISEFDSTNTDVPPREVWHEPKREPKRPTHGYIGLQNHDPGDLVWFREVSVKPL